MDILWAFLALIGVLGLFFIMIYAMKKLNKGISFVNGSKMRVVDRVSVGRDGMLLVVSVGGKLMLVSSTPQSIELLKELDMTPEEYAELSSNSEQGSTMSFSSALSEVLRRKKDGGQKDR